MCSGSGYPDTQPRAEPREPLAAVPSHPQADAAICPSARARQGWQPHSVLTGSLLLPTSLPDPATVSFLMNFPTKETPTRVQKPTPCVLHSHGQAGEGAIAEEQVGRGEGGDAKLLHKLLLAAQYPPHGHILVLQHVQCHLQEAIPRSEWVDSSIPHLTRDAAGLFRSLYKTLHQQGIMQGIMQGNWGGCRMRTSLSKAPWLQEKWGINAAIPTSLPTKELLFSNISAKYWSLFLWKKV